MHAVAARREIDRARRARAGGLHVVERPEFAAARDPLDIHVPWREARLGKRDGLRRGPVDAIARPAQLEAGGRAGAAGVSVHGPHEPIARATPNDGGRDDLMVRRVGDHDRHTPLHAIAGRR